MALNGNQILVYSNIGGTSALIACTKSNSITVDCETIPIASPDTGTWEAIIAGRKSWSITTSFLVTQNNVTNLLQVGNTVTLSIRYRNTAGTSYLICGGNAIIKQCRIDATKGNLCQGSFTFQGTGALSNS